MVIPDWKHHNGLAIDVAVTSPLAKRNLRLVSPCEDYAAAEKHRKYDASFKGTNYYFCAMVFETLGGINDQGQEVMRQLFTFAAQQLGREFSSYCSRGWARVSCCLQRSVAQMIANRIDGRPDAPEPESESMVVVAEAEGGEEHEGEGDFEGGEPLGGEPFLGKPTVGIESLMSKPLVDPLTKQVPLQFSSVERKIHNAGVGGEVGDLGDGGRDGEEGQTIHSENTTHIDSNRLRGQKQGSRDKRSAAHESAKGKKQGPTRRDGSAKKTGTGDYKNSRGEISNKVTYSSNSLDGSSLFSHNTNTSKITSPTYNKHNAGSSTSTSQNVEVRNRVNRGGAL